MLSRMRFLRNLGWLVLLFTVFFSATGSADSYEKVYGVTKDRIRIRSKGSLSADIIDNVRADSCVYLLSGEKKGSTTFVKIRYRNAEGKIDTGYAALKSNGTEYIEVLTDKETQNRFSVSGGKLPSSPAGIMTRAEREERKNGASSEKETKSDTKDEDKNDSETAERA